MAQLIKASGEIVTVAPKRGEVFELEELQELVGGYVEAVRTKDGRRMALDEEGKFKDKPVNEKASELADIFPWDRIVGDAVVGAADEMGV